jgi:hypothetical protein
MRSSQLLAFAVPPLAGSLFGVPASAGSLFGVPASAQYRSTDKRNK